MTHDDQVADDETAPGFTLDRRRLLRGALITAAAAPFTACTSGASEGEPAPVTDPPATSTAGGGGGGGGGGGAPAPVAVPYLDVETWTEPWVWRPADWPTDTLDLNVIENQNPGTVIGFGNPNHVLFSYGGSTPGPTIRMSGDESLAVTLRNLLGPDLGLTYVGPYPDPAPGALTGYINGEELTPKKIQQLAEALGNKRHDFCLGEHTNGIHTVHTTNLHTHGLHVRPGRNPDDTHSDNIFLRVMPQLDLARREAVAEGDDTGTIVCRFLRAGDQSTFLQKEEQVGKAKYEFRLGDVQGVRGQAHPPGTHWYHPHSHGGTADQVTSGMAGFLIVEGDVDEAIRAVLVPDQRTDTGDPSLKSGPHDFRERLMFIQRVLNIPTDPDGARQNLQQNKRSASEPINGVPDPATLLMRPRAVERWRVLNGSVDGKGYRRIMVLKGRFGSNADDRLIRLDENGEPLQTDGSPEPPLTRGEIDEAKMPIHQLSFDGVTLVNGNGDYFLKDLSKQGSGKPSALDSFPSGTFKEKFDHYTNCFADGQSIRDCYVRPNEVYLGPANRTDLIFTAPDLTAGEEIVDYTIIALGVVLHADTPLFQFQKQIKVPFSRDLEGHPSQNKPALPTGPGDVIIGRLRVTGQACVEFDMAKIDDALPKAPPYLQPITDDDPKLQAPGGGFRTRTITYSGWGGAGMPLIDCNVSVRADGTIDDGPDSNNTATAAAFAEFIRANPTLEGLRYARRYDAPTDGQQAFVLLAPNTRTMAIDGRKFQPDDPDRPRMLVNTAEEWTVYNNSDFLWADTQEEGLPANQYTGHYPGVPLTLSAGMAEFEKNEFFHLLTRAVDHPFHMHQNPFWVMRIDVPDVDGNLHNILEEPRWQDVVPVPRHRGRVVFRSRFDDFVGTYVNHCHLLQHEDNGMMQPVEVVPFDRTADADSSDIPEVARANYVVRDQLARGGFSDDATELTNKLTPQPTLTEGYLANVSFIDANATGQVYPGFAVEPPSL